VFKHLTLPTLLRYFVNSPPMRACLEEHCATTVGNWGISATNLVSVPVPLPPLAEQHRIVAKVDELMALCDELEQRLASTASTRLSLLEATLQEALAGSGRFASVDTAPRNYSAM
jgi:type I restriction enzyme S subunit